MYFVKTPVRPVSPSREGKKENDTNIYGRSIAFRLLYVQSLRGMLKRLRSRPTFSISAKLELSHS
jgi:hypothetical protein